MHQFLLNLCYNSVFSLLFLLWFSLSMCVPVSVSLLWTLKILVLLLCPLEGALWPRNIQQSRETWFYASLVSIIEKFRVAEIFSFYKTFYSKFLEVSSLCFLIYEKRIISVLLETRHKTCKNLWNSNFRDLDYLWVWRYTSACVPDPSWLQTCL